MCETAQRMMRRAVEDLMKTETPCPLPCRLPASIRKARKHPAMAPLPTTLQDDVVVREATDEDGEAIAALIASVFADYDRVRFLREEFPELDAVASHFAGRGGRLLVAELDGRIVASFGAAMTHEPGVAEITKVYVARDMRGRGLAHRLFERTVADLRLAGTHAITLWSDTKFLDGHRFYERQGFVRGPGIRALHDASQSLEINYRLDPIPGRATA